MIIGHNDETITAYQARAAQRQSRVRADGHGADREPRRRLLDVRDAFDLFVELAPLYE